MTLRMDHAVFAWPDHDAVTDACDAVGLDPAFGGVHDGGETQMSLVGFPDGSYLELMAPTEPGTEPDRWAGIVDHWDGPENWCIEADVRGLLRRTIAAGAPVDGPHPGSRERPDGTRVEWTNAQYGPLEWRSVLPFAIRDRTPHGYRVPDASVVEGPLTGVAEAVVGVESVAEPLAWFRRLHDVPTPVDVETPLAADVATVPGQPVSFAVPDAGSGRSERLAATEQQPVAFLLGTDDLAAAAEHYGLTNPGEWGDRSFAWFDADVFEGRVGVLETA